MKIVRRMAPVIISLLIICTASAQTSGKTILAIFPHTFDENMISHLLADYAREGHRVFVFIETGGKDGTRVTQIPAGDSMGKLKQRHAFTIPTSYRFAYEK